MAVGVSAQASESETRAHLQIVKRAADADRDLGRRVALVELEVGVDDDLVHAHLLVELDIDQVRLWTVRPVHSTRAAVGVKRASPSRLAVQKDALPVGVDVVVAELLDAVSRLGGR